MDIVYGLIDRTDSDKHPIRPLNALVGLGEKIIASEHRGTGFQAAAFQIVPDTSLRYRAQSLLHMRSRQVPSLWGLGLCDIHD